MDQPPVGESLADRLKRGESPSSIFRLPEEVGGVDQLPARDPEPSLPPPPLPPTEDEEEEEKAHPMPPDHHERPRQRHFAENVLLKVPGDDGIGITMHTPTQILQSQHVRQKTRDYALSAYVLALVSFAVRWAVFFSFLFAGSASGAAFSLLLGLTEVIAASVVALRTWRGSMKFLLAMGNACLIVALAEFGLAVSGCFKNWMHIDSRWARWVAVAFSFVHCLLIWQLGVCLINILHTKMATSYQAAKLSKATKIVHGDPLPPGFSETAKRTQ